MSRGNTNNNKCIEYLLYDIDIGGISSCTDKKINMLRTRQGYVGHVEEFIFMLFIYLYCIIFRINSTIVWCCGDKIVHQKIINLNRMRHWVKILKQNNCRSKRLYQFLLKTLNMI